MQSICDLELTGRRVLIRVDFNVPIKNGVISDASRIEAALPTIEHARDREALVVLASHLGRPRDKRKEGFSLEPVAAYLAERLDCEVFLAEDCVGDAARKIIGDLREGQIAMLENLRFHPGEQNDDERFARDLAKHIDVYVNDAFGSVHRSHASVHALPRIMKIKGIGLLIQKELAALDRLRSKAESPYVAVLGGGKVSDKIGVIEALLSHVDTLLIGGAMANTFLAAKGLKMGMSRIEADKLALARSLLERAKQNDVQVLLPVDLVVAHDLEVESGEIVNIRSVPEESMALDIGPVTLKQFREKILRAKTVFWNGPLGLSEHPAFVKGTVGIGEALRDCRGYTVVGGGDSVAAVKSAGLSDQFDHVSTGGGASLEYIEGRRLPGIEALM